MGPSFPVRVPPPVLLAAGLVAACASAPEEEADADTAPRTFPSELGGARPAPVIAPALFDEAVTYPAIVLLHGYSVSAQLEDLLFGLQARVDGEGFLLVLPEGTKDRGGFQFWNATPECCDFGDEDVDDLGYLTDLTAELRRTWRVGTVAVVGHSNGGYMGYRLACKAPQALDRLMVLAGADTLKEPRCEPGDPIPLLHVHSDDDDTITYGPNDGSGGLVETVGAVETVRRYASRTGCTTRTRALGTADLLSTVEGEESVGVAYEGCDAPVSLWTVQGGDHTFLGRTATFQDGVVAFAKGEADTLP